MVFYLAGMDRSAVMNSINSWSPHVRYMIVEDKEKNCDMFFQ